MKYETEQMIFSYPQDEWFLYHTHSDLSRYVSNCTGDGGVWCLTSLSTIWQLYRGDQFYWWRKPGYPEKITDLPQVTGKLLSHIVVSSTPRMSGIWTHSFSGDRRVHFCVPVKCEMKRETKHAKRNETKRNETE